MWLAREREVAAVRREHAGYERAPVAEDEFSPLFQAQTWPR